MEDWTMEYNSERELLTMPEYGRNVQKLIKHAKTIEDKAEKQAFIERIVDLMLQMSPQSRNLDDYRDKLWRHVFKIAEFDLDVMPPNGAPLTKEQDEKRPDRIEYPVTQAKYRHYGHHVQELVKKAVSMEKGPVRAGFVETIGNYMKLAYKTWNKEHYVSDEIIINDLESLSGNELKVNEDASLDNLANSNRRRSSKRSSSSNNKGRGRRRRRN